MEHIYDILILGGGPAGYSAALYTARAGLDTLVIEKICPGGQMATTDIIDNYPGFDAGIDGMELGMKMAAGAERFGAKSAYGEVTEVVLDKEIKRVVTTDGTYLGKTVIIATGASPRPLGLESEQNLIGRGVHYCAHCDGRFYKGKTVMVVGGGNSAASDALYLSGLAEKVIVVHRRDTLRATKIYHAPLMRAENVEFCWNSTVSEILADMRVGAVKVTDLISGEEREIKIDGLFVSIGRQPATELFADQLALDAHGYIVADESTKTGLAGVFAAGDVRTKELRQVVTAAADGAVAAHMAETYLAMLE
ncbi:MAG: thioredoxin-disulfide reductase [Clostridia bacterium]|nr:thioredoxin-disulfide reductase [Clostridia bacterium]MBQ2256201.1 thioredoxin-disulfide reductase [Clostridia bacterium]